MPIKSFSVLGKHEESNVFCFNMSSIAIKMGDAFCDRSASSDESTNSRWRGVCSQ